MNLRGGALLYAIVISFIIAVLLSSLILYSYYSRLNFLAYTASARVNLNCGSAATLLLSGQELVRPGERRIVDLYGNGGDSVLMSRRYWGLFECMAVRAFSAHAEASRLFLAGNVMESTSIYLLDQGKPLSVAGQTYLKGELMLPKSGIKTSIIEGKTFTGSYPPSGMIKESAVVLPELNPELLGSLKNAFDQGSYSSDTIVPLSSAGNELSNSFLDPSLVLYAEKSGVLSGSYRGNIVILCPGELTLSSSLVLDNVLVFARRIRVEDSFSGTAQLFATDTLVTGKRCRFGYPSVLAVYRDAGSKGALVQLDEDSELTGFMLVLEEQVSGRKSQVSIEKNAAVNGLVYSPGELQLKGIVKGSLYTGSFVLRTLSGIYENHLLDVTVDAEGLSREFAGPAIFKKPGNKTIMKWLN